MRSSTDVLTAAQALCRFKTRARARTPSPEVENRRQPFLSQLCDDLLVAIAQCLLSGDEIGAIGFLSATCKNVYPILASVRAEAQGWRRLCWEPKLTTAHFLLFGENLPCAAAAHEGRTVRRGSSAPLMVGAIAAGKPPPTHLLSILPLVTLAGCWVLPGTLLPSHGIMGWEVTIDCTYRPSGCLVIGVCDAAATCGWGLKPYFLDLPYFESEIFRKSLVGNFVVPAPPPPEGFPDGHRTQVNLLDQDSYIVGSRGRAVSANGAVIECIFDADAGSLSFRLNGGPKCKGLDGFPRNVSMRPFVWLYCGDWDQVTIGRRWKSMRS